MLAPQIFKRITIAATAAMVATSVVPAVAATPDPNTATRAEPKQSAKKGPKYCIESKHTGSRIARKVCKTRADWIDENDFDPIAQK